MPHDHILIDSDKHLIIDPVTRKITNPVVAKNILIQYDHNSERFGFDIPRYIDGHDMSLSDIVEIHYINASSDRRKSNYGIYRVDDLQALEDSVEFSWLISANATTYAGTLTFIVRFICKNGSDTEYSWGTDIYSAITIKNSIQNYDLNIDDGSDKVPNNLDEIYKYIDEKVETLGSFAIATYDESVEYIES